LRRRPIKKRNEDEGREKGYDGDRANIKAYSKEDDFN
jgi:hypothetical protein